MTDLGTLDYIHSFYVASDIKDLDAAWEDGKQRAIQTLEHRIERVGAATRREYNRAHCIDAALAGKRGEEA